MISWVNVILYDNSSLSGDLLLYQSGLPSYIRPQTSHRLHTLNIRSSYEIMSMCITVDQFNLFNAEVAHLHISVPRHTLCFVVWIWVMVTVCQKVSVSYIIQKWVTNISQSPDMKKGLYHHISVSSHDIGFILGLYNHPMRQDRSVCKYITLSYFSTDVCHIRIADPDVL